MPRHPSKAPLSPGPPSQLQAPPSPPPAHFSHNSTCPVNSPAGQPPPLPRPPDTPPPPRPQSPSQTRATPPPPQMPRRLPPSPIAPTPLRARSNAHEPCAPGPATANDSDEIGKGNPCVYVIHAPAPAQTRVSVCAPARRTYSVHGNLCQRLLRPPPPTPRLLTRSSISQPRPSSAPIFPPRSRSTTFRSPRCIRRFCRRTPTPRPRSAMGCGCRFP